jgi:antitoxin CptB
MNREPMTDPESAALETRRRRLLFRATHRGTFENDLMIGGFVRASLADLGPDDLDALEALLELPDTELADWLTGRQPLPEDAPPMLRRIRESVLGGGAAPFRSPS